MSSLVLFSACSASNDDTPETETLTLDVGSESLGPDGVGYYYLEDIALHSEKDDCWFAIDGKVYDVSSYNSHPGGMPIFDACGTDATELFNTRPMGSGTAHSSRARSMLDQFYIGEFLE